jgi:ATP phosphoribosyltransferase
MTKASAQSGTDKLLIAIPSKGRLQENTMAFFARAGLSMAQEGGNRAYQGSIRTLPGVEILLLSASEIVAKLASGETHFGVTGEDLIREALPDAASSVELLTPLGFGHADVVVAVPKGWIDASTMEDLEEIAADFHARHGRRMRVATKYVNMTRRFFAEHGVADYRIVESLGATEGAPASGTAEFIVDITTTGSTLEANALKVIEDGTILRSQANLVASLGAPWPEQVQSLARKFLGRISAENTARTTRELRFSAPSERFSALSKIAGEQGFSLKGNIVQSGAATTDCVLRVPAKQATTMAESMIAEGANHVSIAEAHYVFEQNAPLFDRLTARIARHDP